MECSLPGSSIHGILQAEILDGESYPSPGESSRPRNWTRVSCTVGGFLLSEPPALSAAASPSTHLILFLLTPKSSLVYSFLSPENFLCTSVAVRPAVAGLLECFPFSLSLVKIHLPFEVQVKQSPNHRPFNFYETTKDVSHFCPCLVFHETDFFIFSSWIFHGHECIWIILYTY